MKNAKGSAIVLVIVVLVLAIIGGIYWYLSQNSGQPAEPAAQTTPIATIDASTKSSISGTAKNINAVSVNIIATNLGTYTGSKTLYGSNVPVTNGRWILTIPPNAFTGFSGQLKVEVGFVNPSGAVTVLTTGTLNIN